MSFTLMEAIDQLIAEDALAALPTWEGAPLGFTSRYFSSTDLDAAQTRRAEEDRHRAWEDRHRHGWISDPCGARASHGLHTIASYTSDTSCRWDYHGINDGQRPRLVAERIPCECVGNYLHLIVCDTCELHWIDPDWNVVVEAWHDHAFPGWRELPVLPPKLRGQMGNNKMNPKLEDWLDTNYPEHFRIPGAPILTNRGGTGTRHVPNYSPYGGFDLSVDEQGRA